MDQFDRSVLVVEDDPVGRAYLSRVLERAGVPVRAVAGGQAALSALAESFTPFVVTDWMMPGMDGIELCREIRAREWPEHVFVLFLSAQTERGQIVAALDAGADDYLTKPFGADELLARLRRGQRHLSLQRALQTTIREKNELLRTQEIDIGMARTIRELIDGDLPAYVALPAEHRLALTVYTAACHREGGDHLFFRAFPSGRTLLALQDQSGHDVSCVLRGVFTDLLNAHLLLGGSRSPSNLLATVNRLLCRSGALQDADFLTSLVAVVDHENLTVHLSSAGHPPALLVRDGDVRAIPAIGGEGASGPLGVRETMAFADLRVPLRPGDGLLLYTDGLPEMPRAAGLPALTLDDLCQLARQILREGRATGAVGLAEELLAAVSRLAQGAISAEGVNRSLDDVTVVGVDVEPPAPWRRAHVTAGSTEQISDRIAVLHEEMAAEWRRHGWAEPELRLRTVLAEAVVNAWTHGARRDPQRPIEVAWQWTTHFVLRVTDPGDGFDLDDIGDPTQDHRRREHHGRGIYLIRELADQASWSDHGRTLTTAFRRHRRRATAASALTRTSQHHNLLEPAPREEPSWT